MAKRRQRRRNLDRKWIWIGAGTAAVAVIGTIVVVRRRHSAPGDGQVGSVGPDGSTNMPWYLQTQDLLRKLCGKPSSLTLQERDLLISEVFLPAWRSYRAAHLPQGPLDPQTLNDALQAVAHSVLDQGCQKRAPGSGTTAVSLANGARLRDVGLSGQ